MVETIVRTRIAPSPTGFLHIGTARTSLFNWLFARKNKGEFILRIEDTDLERSKLEYEKNIIDGLRWLGLDWSNGEIYRQSKRLDIYEDYLKQLLDSGKAFWCYHTKEELEQEGKEQMAKKEAPRHVCKYKQKNVATSDVLRTSDVGRIIRLRVDENSNKKVVFEDKIRGKIEFEEKLLGNFSLAKDLRTPLYNFAVVVDDIEMKISHVIRGEDHISNTPKQILIYEALFRSSTPKQGVNLPIFAHLPLILGPDKSKLSKRHGETSISEYAKDYLPEALVNFMGFLGYTYSKEILNKEEMVEEFELEKVHKSGAIFDVKKLNWINSNYVRSLNVERFKSLTDLKELPDEAVPLITERLEKLSDVKSFDYFWKEPSFAKAASFAEVVTEAKSEGKPEHVQIEFLKWKRATLEESISALKEVYEVLKKTDFTKENLQKALNELAERIVPSTHSTKPQGGTSSEPQSNSELVEPTGSGRVERGLVYWPLRVALTGKEKSPDPIDIALVLGKEKTLERVKNCLNY